METPERAKSGKKENLVINGDKTAREWQEMFRERERLQKIIEVPHTNLCMSGIAGKLAMQW